MENPRLIHVEHSEYRRQRGITVKIIMSICTLGVLVILTCPFI